MPDIFGYDREAKAGYIFGAEESFVNIEGAQLYMAQSVDITYAQEVMDVFEIGSKNIYWVAGRPSGQGNIMRLMGPKNSTAAAMAKMQVCTGGATMIFNLAAPCAERTSGNQTITASGVVMRGKSYAIDVNKIMVAEGLALKIAKVSES